MVDTHDIERRNCILSYLAHIHTIMEGKEGRKEERRKESVDSGMCSSSSSGQVSPVSSCGEVRRRDSVLKGVRQRMVSLV